MCRNCFSCFYHLTIRLFILFQTREGPQAALFLKAITIFSKKKGRLHEMSTTFFPANSSFE